MGIAALLLAAAATAGEIPLPELEVWVNRYVAGASAALRENASCLREDQERWARTRDACGNEDCRRNAALDRLAELHALQPGINLKRELPLPPRPALVWAIAPAADPELRPRANAKSKPRRVEGRFIYPGDGGYFLESAGERYFVIGELGLDGTDAMILPTIVKVNADARIAASGRMVEAKPPLFDRRYCILLHRLP
jgi:hypothetical protein